MSEKRQFERAEYEGDVEIQLESQWSTARLRDISVGGAYVLTSKVPAFGERVVLRLYLPALADRGPRELEGTVRWTRPDGFGLQFGLTSALDTYGLASFVANKRKA